MHHLSCFSEVYDFGVLIWAEIYGLVIHVYAFMMDPRNQELGQSLVVFFGMEILPLLWSGYLKLFPVYSSLLGN